MTVIVLSPAESMYVKPRRCGSGRTAACTVTPWRSSSGTTFRPSSSSPIAVNSVLEPASRASCTAATAPPPAASHHVSPAWTISPLCGPWSTRTNSMHSACPTTAMFADGSLTSEQPGALEQMMNTVAIPPFERFYQEYRDEIYAYLRKLAGRDGADDAFQETFLRALRGYPRLEHGRHLRAWAYRIATRVAIDERRKRRPTAEIPE